MIKEMLIEKKRLKKAGDKKSAKKVAN